jgi:hypothetical protein
VIDDGNLSARVRHDIQAALRTTETETSGRSDAFIELTTTDTPRKQRQRAVDVLRALIVQDSAPASKRASSRGSRARDVSGRTETSATTANSFHALHGDTSDDTDSVDILTRAVEQSMLTNDPVQIS